MHLQVDNHGATAVLTVTTPRFTQAVSEAIRQEALAAIRDEVSTYLVDLGHVTQIDSAALGVLNNLMKQVGRGRRLELCGPTPPARKLLRLTRMDTVFRIHGSVTEGLDFHFAPRARVG